MNSFSEYYYTPAKLTFICLCIIMAINMVSTTKWEIPALLIIIIAIFPCKEFKILHNASAIIFFIWCTLIMCKDKRLAWMGYVMLAASPIYIVSIYWCEVIQVFLISLFHLKYLKRINRVKIIKKKKRYF